MLGQRISNLDACIDRVQKGLDATGGARQYDIFDRDDAMRQKWTSICNAMDRVNTRYAKSIVSIGPWTPPPGGYAGGKIAFSRVPDMEDFW